MGTLPVYSTSITAGKRESTSHVSRLAPRRLHLYLVQGCCFAEFEHLLGGAGREHMHGSGADAGPAGLMAGAEAGAVVTGKVLIEQQIIAPARVLLKRAGAPVDRPAATLVPQKDTGQAARELLSDLIQGQVPAGARGTFDREIIAVIGVILQQAPDNQRVDRHPDWSAPVGVAAEHAGVGL